MKRFTLFGSMLLLTLMVTFVGMEIIVREFYAQEQPLDWMRSDPKYGYVNRENYHSLYPFLRSDFVMDVLINSAGLRERELRKEVHFADGVKRIIALGDSGTFGFGVNVEERFTNRLEQLLQKKGHDVRVINTGVCGWGTIQETLYALDHIKYFKPDYFLLTFVGNDPANDKKFLLGLKDAEKGIFSFPGKKTIRKYSHLYRYLAKYVQPIVVYWYSRLISGDRELTIDNESASIISGHDWERTLNTIMDFHTKFLEYNPEGTLIIQSSNPMNQSIRENFRDIDNGKTLLYVDLSEQMEDLAKLGHARLAYDGHWSREMHQASANALAQVFDKYLSE